MLSRNQKRSWATSLARFATLMVLSSDAIERHVSLRTTQIVNGNRSQGGSALPAASERLVELNDAEQLVQPDLPEVQLGLQQVPVRIKSIELGVHASLISHIGQAFALLQNSNEALLFCPGFVNPLVRNECVGHFGECGLDRFLVSSQRNRSLSFRQPHA